MKSNFSISPRILSHLGEDLIKNASIAIIELVKNSYDACATICKVDFTSVQGKLQKLTIQDNGFGMGRQIIEDVWLKIGTDHKFKTVERNICGRIPLGEKGIGRLGVHKLGNNIELLTKAANEKQIRVAIDWNKLSEIKKIEDFTIDVDEVETSDFFQNSSGTIITITQLKGSWDRRMLREVYRDLVSLNSPFSNNNETFKVDISTNENLFDGLPNFEDIKNSALYLGHCKMDGNKIVDFKYEFKPWHTLQKVDNGRKKNIQDLNANELTIINKGGDVIDLNTLEIGPIEFDLLIYEMGAQIFSYVNAEKKSIKDYMRDNGGIRVYRDGVRVYNYGEKDNDWLGLEMKRLGRFAGNVSNNMIIGAAKINRANSSGLREKSNREGFIENEAYFAFRSAVEYAMSIIVRERNVDKHLLTTLYRKNKVIEPVLSDLGDLTHYVETTIENAEHKNEILKYLHRINDQYKEVRDILIKSANAGLNLSVVIHEIEKIISELGGSIERNELSKAVRLSEMLEKIIKGYSAMIKKSDIQKNTLNKIVELALDNYSFRFLDHGIQIVSNWRDNSLQAYLAEAESISVLTNLLDNAIFWLSYARKDNRKIGIYLTDELRYDQKEYASIVVCDNGPGFNIPAEVATQPFITGKPHNIGSGLGLHVASEMMKGMNGHLEFIDEHEIDFPDIFRSNQINKAIIAISFPKNK